MTTAKIPGQPAPPRSVPMPGATAAASTTGPHLGAHSGMQTAQIPGTGSGIFAPPRATGSANLGPPRAGGTTYNPSTGLYSQAVSPYIPDPATGKLRLETTKEKRRSYMMKYGHLPHPRGTPAGTSASAPKQSPGFKLGSTRESHFLKNLKRFGALRRKTPKR